MRNLLVLFACLFFSSSYINAQEEEQLTEEEMQQFMADLQLQIDSVEKTFTYQTGEVSLPTCNATLQVPPGFEYLDEAQAKRVLEDLWGNPPGPTMGLLVPAGGGVMQDNSWAFELSWDDMGYVEDDDAEDIDYEELLTEMKKEGVEENKLRVEQGYDAVELVGWASPPYYDEENKVLHWAKNFRFGEAETNTLNYNVRILGRKGVIVANAIGRMDQLDMIKTHIDPVLHSVKFDEGFRYADYSSSSGDKVAAYTIGGLVAGKVLAKVGIFAFFAKFAKVIFIAIAAAGAGIWRFIRGRKKTDVEPVVNQLPENQA